MQPIPKTCLYPPCRKEFIPNVPWQKYCCLSHAANIRMLTFNQKLKKDPERYAKQRLTHLIRQALRAGIRPDQIRSWVAWELQ